MEVDGVSRQPVKSVEGWIIVVLNLHEETSEEDLQDKFADYGAIKNLHLNLDRRTGYVKGYALIEYANQTEAQSAIEEANGTQLLGQKVVVDFAFVEPPEKVKDIETEREERDRSKSPERR
ncbi:Uncharacterized RNA-binding protein C23A1.09 [Taphrina deformans PYCC 5710]|uniref:Uncharacterized RNA-binding protein C23A1.09 n=1 Tax=Taphrina deformans (strain PYCC 5710 / ATCC 11124 / CBS 356.35 / IMI 108563 / JCM 9778 / NBRC 8474) TaxID=1097556 RepID=R4XG44_TAPDE|nr:Uncharacterized RNA-binding protein C23A1.09 [Taphrina deformans PYCC 5710]|eukprot:CCG82354.1 Uncharacterized RNA-binding protein C23A1.09 [Taphrina deformans PYCC 5710]